MINGEKKYLEMDPFEVMDLFDKELEFQIPEDLDSRENRMIASDIITKALAYDSYLDGLETRVRILKRSARGSKQTSEADKFKNYEEAFQHCRTKAKNAHDNITKLMTLKRLELDEQKSNSKIT